MSDASAGAGTASLRLQRAGLLLLALVLIAPARAEAQDPVHWSAQLSATNVAPGARIALAVTAVIDPGWYIYSITQGEGGPVPSRISLAAEQPFSLSGTVEGTVPVVKYDRNFEMQVEVHEGRVAYTVPVGVASEAGAGANEIQVRARYQACTDRVCLPAQTERLAVPVTIARR